jgi:hypothetical protein
MNALFEVLTAQNLEIDNSASHSLLTLLLNWSPNTQLPTQKPKLSRKYFVGKLSSHYRLYWYLHMAWEKIFFYLRKKVINGVIFLL